MDDLTGKQFGAYQIISPFGQGGMATVYKAYQPSMDRFVALKVLPRFHSADPEFLGRFEQEAKALAQLQHPHILPVYDFGESEGYTYFVMPLIKDGNLAECLADEQLSLERINQIISQVGVALDFAHSRGFVHRDVKPSNILLDESGNCMLMDFGIAKIIEGSKEFTRTGGILGTPVYMSPEQGSGQKVDHRTDVYSMGIILYEMVTGKPPFEAETPVAIIFKHVHEPLPPPSTVVPEISDQVEKVILKSLAKKPDDRFKTMREMVDALSRAVVASQRIEPAAVELPPTQIEFTPVLTEQPIKTPTRAEVVEVPAEDEAEHEPSSVRTELERLGSIKGLPMRRILMLVGGIAAIAITTYFALERLSTNGADQGSVTHTRAPTQSSEVFTSPTEDQIDDQADPEESVLILGTTDSWTSFDSAWVYSYHDWELTHQCADGLLNIIPGTAGDVEPALAESYEVSSDGLEYVFHLRQGVTFPNGDLFTADAVVFSLERIAPINEAEGQNAGLLYTSYVENVEKIDDFTVMIRMLGVFPFTPQLVATNVWKIHNPNEWSATEAGTNNTACGIGPYVITSFTEGEEIIFERNESYHGDPPKTDKIIVRYFAESPAMTLALLNGEIDVAWKSLSPADLETLSSVDGITTKTAGGTEIRYIVYNATSPPFNNPDVRLGLAKMLNREQLADLGWQGSKVPLYSMVPPGFLGHKPSYQGTEDMEAGVALLASAGYHEDNPLVMDLWFSPTHYGDTEPDVAAILKQQWEASGVVRVELQSLEWAAFRDAGRSGSLPVSLLGWHPDYLDPDNYTYTFAHSPASWSGSNYNNPEMDALLEAQATELNEAARISILEEIQDFWVAESPFVPLGQGKLFIAYRENVSGVVLDPIANLHYFLLEK
jgi:peptide/nickel transport system substrate-binding protein